MGGTVLTRDTINKPLKSGWCTNSFHEKCTPALTNQSGKTTRCSCTCHTGKEEPVDMRNYCCRCGDTFGVKVPAKDGTKVCFDTDACDSRFTQLLDKSPSFRFWHERDKDKGVPHVRTKTKEQSPRHGVCEYSGKPTKGGRFAPGNDAKLKGALLAAGKEGNVEAVAEIILRGWPVKKDNFDPDVLRQARELTKHKGSGEWLIKRIETRLRLLQSGVDPQEAVVRKRAPRK